MPLILVVPAPVTVIPPIVLFEMLIVAGVPVPAIIPEKIAPAPLVLKVTLPVTDWLPKVFAVTVPQLNAPVTNEIKDWAVEVLVVVIERF